MKHKNRFDHRVIVEVKEPYFFLRETEEEDWIKAAETLIESIKRHCDGVGYVYYHYSEETLCSFCGREWSEFDSDDEASDPECKEGMPDCCEEAQNEWLKEQTKGKNNI